MLKKIIITLSVVLAMSTSAMADTIKWYDQNSVIAHAMGSVDGKTETNSKEAFLESYEKGYRVMEVDLTFTSDGVLVARHDFDQNSYYVLDQVVLNDSTEMTSSRFITEKINYKYTSLTFEDVLRLMDEYEDVYIITDTKDTNVEDVEKQFVKIMDSVKNLNMEHVLDRLIVQVYNEDMFFSIKEIYDFENWIFTLYQLQDPDFASIAQFCVDNEIDTVTIPFESNKITYIDAFKDKGIKVFTHTVNLLNPTKRYLNLGYAGIYSDFLTPADLTYINYFKQINYATKVSYENKIYSVETYNIMNEEYYSLQDFCNIKDFDMVVDEGIFVDTINSYEGKDYSLYTGTDKPVGVETTIEIDGQQVAISMYVLDKEYFISATDLGGLFEIEMEFNRTLNANEFI